MKEEIRPIILAALPDAHVVVEDPNNDGHHFQALVVSPEFDGLTLVKQHRLVMTPLREAFKEKVHALALRTMTPAQWEALQTQ
jgi:acid stress-induced BolA-like protein IbaG/YrbA